MKVTSIYKRDLAYVHHVGFGRFSEKAGRELVGIFRKNGIDTGLVIDLGCGSGLWARMLMNEGYDVLGIDLSKEMTAIARKTAPGAEFRSESKHEAELNPCVSVTALGEVINYCAGGDPSPKALEKLFRKTGACLRAGGIFTFDIIVQSGDDVMNYRSWTKGTDWAVLVEVSETPQKNELTREITTFRKEGDLYRKTEELHRIRTLDADEITGLLERAGFEVSVSRGYGTQALGPRRLAFVARRRSI